MNAKGNNDYLNGIYPPKKRELVVKQPQTLTVGQRLRRERVLRKLTIEQMASYLDISTAYLGAVERGKRPVSSRLLKRIHDRLGLSYDFLLEGYSVSGQMISQYVRESVSYSTQHNLDVLLKVCSPDELESCYHMIHTFLSDSRKIASDRKPEEG